MHRTSRFAASAIALAAASSLGAIASATPLDSTVVFTAGDGGYHTFRIPAITTAANGDLLAFAEGRKNSSSDTGDIDLVERRSSDGGKTWSPLQVVADNGVDVAGNPTPVIDAATGRVILITTHNVATNASPTRTFWEQTSDNNGATWTAPREITSQGKAADWVWVASGPDHAIQLTRGAHAGRIVAPIDFTSPSGNGGTTIYSDDGGLTWQRGVAVYGSSTLKPNETAVVELTDGRVALNARNGGGTAGTRVEAYSSDGGKTFGTKTTSPTLIDPNVQGSIIRYSAIDQGGTRNEILFSNPADAASRINLTVRSSFDETATWNAGKVIYRGPSAYSDLAVPGNGRAGVLYENGVASPYEKITYSSWGAGWLADPTVVQLDMNEKATGTPSTATGAILDSRGYGMNGTATGALSYVTGDAVYGNTSAMRFTSAGGSVHVKDTPLSALDFDYNDSFTIETVFRTTAHGTGDANGSGPLVSKDVGSARASYWVRVENGKIRFLVSDGTNEPSVLSSFTVNDGKWHHLAAVCDRSDDQLRLYLDYVLVGTAVDTTTGGVANSNDLVIGGFNNAAAGTKQFVGDIDLARVSSGALTPSQFVQPALTPEPTMLITLASIAATAGQRRRRAQRSPLSRSSGAIDA